MPSNPNQDFLDGFAETPSIGQELADKINAWNEANYDEDKCLEKILSNMSGEEVIIKYTENGLDEKEVIRMLHDVGYSLQEDSDDTIAPEPNSSNDIDEHLNTFLFECIEVANSYPSFVKGISLREGTAERKEEVRIVIPSNEDLRKLSATNARKIMFMHFLKDIREKAAHHSMIDEAFCFSQTRQEFLIILKPLAQPKRR